MGSGIPRASPSEEELKEEFKKMADSIGTWGASVASELVDRVGISVDLDDVEIRSTVQTVSSKVGGTIDSILETGRRVTRSPAEHRAEVLLESAQIAEDVCDAFEESYSYESIGDSPSDVVTLTSDDDKPGARDGSDGGGDTLSQQRLCQLLEETHDLKSFDSIAKWAQQKPRWIIVQLIYQMNWRKQRQRRKREKDIRQVDDDEATPEDDAKEEEVVGSTTSIPRYAPHSLVAAIFADAVLIERQRHFKQVGGAPKSMPTHDRYYTNGSRDVMGKDESLTVGVNEDAALNVENRSSKRRKTYQEAVREEMDNRKRRFDGYAVERDIAKSLARKMLALAGLAKSTTVQAVATAMSMIRDLACYAIGIWDNDVSDYPDSDGADDEKGARRWDTDNRLLRVLDAGSRLTVGLLMTIGGWAASGVGGDGRGDATTRRAKSPLTATQALTIGGVYAVVTRGGVRAFFGALIAVKFFVMTAISSAAPRREDRQV